MTKSIELLQLLGFNQLEAMVYSYLLTEKPQTAYSIGKSLGKPTANVYKAIESLMMKGAVQTVEGANRLCKAVPADEFLRLVERNHRQLTEKAKLALQGLSSDYQDEEIYRLHAISLVIERCRSMLSSSQSIAVIDVFPGLVETLRPAVEEAIQRGVRMYVQVYQPVEIEGAEVTCVTKGDDIIKYWRSQQLNLVVDGRECLVALMDIDLKKVFQALWSRGLYLSCIIHSGLMQEFNVHQLISVSDLPNGAERMRSILSDTKFFINSDVPGQRELFNRYVDPIFHSVATNKGNKND